MDREKEIYAADGRLLEAARPKEYGGAKGIEAKRIASYEDSCIAMSQHLSRDPKKMTVLEYHRAIRMLERQAGAVKNNTKKPRVNGKSD